MAALKKMAALFKPIKNLFIFIYLLFIYMLFII